MSSTFPTSPTTPESSAPRTLRRRLDNHVIAGVCSGIADYFAIDPILVRLAFIAVTFAGGAGILAYIVLWIVMPPAPRGEPLRPVRTGVTSNGGIWLGALLIVVGGLFLVGNTGILWWWSWSFFWPLALIALGLLLLSRRVRG